MSNEDSTVRKLAIEQRKRLVGGILSHAESEFFDRLTPEQRREFRDKVLSSVNAYHDFILDLIKVNREDIIRDEEAMQVLRQVHSSQQRLEREMRDQAVPSG